MRLTCFWFRLEFCYGQEKQLDFVQVFLKLNKVSIDCSFFVFSFCGNFTFKQCFCCKKWMPSSYIFQLRSSIFILLFVDHTLLGQVIETVNVTDEFQCHRKCIQNNTCKSFNVHPRESNLIKKTCEMNNQTRQMKPKQYKKKIGSSYHGSVEVSLICVLN